MSGNLQLADARLEPIAQKVLAGERLTSEDGLALFQSHDLLGVGLACEPRAREAPREHLLLQHEPAHQSHECLRRALQVVRIRAFAGCAGRVHVCAR